MAMSKDDIIETKTDKLLKALEVSPDSCDGKNGIKAVIFTGTPDPDSIGSAIGMRYIIAKKFGGHADIICNAAVSHPQNKTMLNVLNVQVLSEDEVLSKAHGEKSLTSRYNKFIFVDFTPALLKWYKDSPVTIVIDHHKGSYENENAYVEIENVGACCTLVWKHIQELGIDSPLEDEDGTNTATAMLMGIKTDTSDLLTENTTQLDFEAYAELTKKSNRKHLGQIINYKLPAYYFDLKSRLEDSENVFNENSFYIGCLGQISISGRDSIPMFADERLRMEGITTSIIFGFVDDMLVASLRTFNASMDAHVSMQKIFGKEYAGGKQGAAAAKVPLGVLSLGTLPTELSEKACCQYRDVIFNKIREVCFNG